jgi:Rps23 Pro-64 3,4-dihydroxylase Tpa1-like proline 4-hydroxylase
MAGIKRFSQRQQQLREKITAELADLRAQQDAPNQNAAAVDKLADQIAWDTRVFDERRHTIGYVCEVPSTIERRLFALARVIQQKLD